jgi:hypothetical protein
MNVSYAVEAIKRKFSETGSPTEIPLLNGRMFTAELTDGGVIVSNLGAQPFLPWVAFQEAVCILIRQGGRAGRGNAMQYRLGEPGLPVDSVEGHVALVVYGKHMGDAVFRRIAPIAGVLIWAGICQPAPNELILRDFAR